MRLRAILLRLCGVRKWKPSPHYAECRRRAEVRLGDLSLPGEPICEQCAGQQVRCATCGRLVYAIAVAHRCATCGREFEVTRRSGFVTDDGAPLEMDAVWPVPGAPFDEPHSEEAWRALRR